MKNEALRLSRFPELRLSPSMLEMLRIYYLSYLRDRAFNRGDGRRNAGQPYVTTKHRTVWALQDRGLLENSVADSPLMPMRITGLGLWVARNYWDLNGKDSIE